MSFLYEIFGYPSDRLTQVVAGMKTLDEGTMFVFEYRLRKSHIKYVFFTRSKGCDSVLNDAFLAKEAIDERKKKKQRRLYEKHESEKKGGKYLDVFSYLPISLYAINRIELLCYVDEDKDFVDDNIHLLDAAAMEVVNYVATVCMTNSK